jgi:hypothetical protein
MGTSGWLFEHGKETFGLHEMQGISWLVEELPFSRGLFAMELVI